MVEVDDLQVKQTFWPENSKDVYVLFLEEVCQQGELQSTIQNNFTKVSKPIHSVKNDYHGSVQINNNQVHMNRLIDDKLNADNNYKSSAYPINKIKALLKILH